MVAINFGEDSNKTGNKQNNQLLLLQICLIWTLINMKKKVDKNVEKMLQIHSILSFMIQTIFSTYFFSILIMTHRKFSHLAKQSVQNVDNKDSQPNKRHSTDVAFLMLFGIAFVAWVSRCIFSKSLYDFVCVFNSTSPRTRIVILE